MKRIDPLLRTCPWRVMAVFSPIERVLHRLEADCTVDTVGRQIVFREQGNGELYDLPAAIKGVVDFHELAASRHGLPIDVSAMRRFANKIENGSPIFEQDLEAVKACIAACKQRALKLRVSQAADIVDTVRIGAEIERIRRAA